MLARGHAHAAEQAAPAPTANSPALAPVTAPQHSRLPPARATATAADSSQSQPDAELALRPKRLFLSQTEDSGLTAGDGDAAQTSPTSGSEASEGIEPALHGAQQARRNGRDGEAVTRAMSRKPLARGSGTDGQPSGRGADNVIDLVTPPTAAEPGGGRDGDGGPLQIVLSSLSSSSCSELRADVPVTPSRTPHADAARLTAAAMASSRLETEPAAVEPAPSAAAQSQSEIAMVTRQGDTQQRGTAADSSLAAISAVAARTCVGTLDMTLVGGAQWLSDNASPFSDIVIDLDTPSTGPASVQTPALAGRVGRKCGRDRRVLSPG